MRTLTAYCLDDRYSFTPPDAGAEPVTVVLRDGMEVREERDGVLKVFRAGTPSGFTLTTALVLNWCTVLEETLEG